MVYHDDDVKSRSIIFIGQFVILVKLPYTMLLIIKDDNDNGSSKRKKDFFLVHVFFNFVKMYYNGHTLYIISQYAAY